MNNKLCDNLASYLSDVVSRASMAVDEAERSDLLRRVTTEIQERVNAERLEAADRLASWLAHQINNSLGAISGSAQLLGRYVERDISDPHQAEKCLRYVQSIQAQTERCAAITGDLLEFQRARDVEIGTVDLAEAVEEAVELATYGRENSCVSVAPGVRAGIPTVQTDKELLVRVLYEVIRNAVTAASRDGAVTIDAATDGPEWVRITVRDSGPGIPDELLARVFDPFFSTRAKARGLGLTVGLAIVRQLGGSIEIGNAEGGGTVVSVRVPARPQE